MYDWVAACAAARSAAVSPPAASSATAEDDVTTRAVARRIFDGVMRWSFLSRVGRARDHTGVEPVLHPVRVRVRITCSAQASLPSDGRGPLPVELSPGGHLHDQGQRSGEAIARP